MERGEWFLLRLQGERVYRDEEDRVIWIELKSRKFSVIALYSILELVSLVSFLMGIIGTPRCCQR